MAIEVPNMLAPSFHGGHHPDLGPGDLAAEPQAKKRKKIRLLRYRFFTHYHPYVTQLVNRLIKKGVRGLLAADTAKPALREQLFSAKKYAPNALLVVNDERHRHPVADLDFSPSGAYSGYNWELFYHVPMTVAVHLSRNERFADAQRWLHYIFDPTDDSDGPTPERFWKVKPFREGDPTLIERVLVNLSTGADPKLWEETIDAIGKWKDTPFRPFAVARYRHTAFMLRAVMAYLDNLVAWGDSLFRQDTAESINEATQHYVTAANLLGPRPQEVPSKGEAAAQSYASLRGSLDEFGNALVAIETELPFDRYTEVPESSDDASLSALTSVATSLYFCVPRNDKLLGYWDTVADRLFKIRNSLDIHGVFRRLPLFDPPIDPALLAKAAAAGVDVAAIVSGLGQPLPLVRFGVLIAKATEICHEVKMLGNQLLTAIEKQDAELLAVLRASHETEFLRLAETVRYGQWQEAIKTRQALEQSFQGAFTRFVHYERLLGSAVEFVGVPGLDELDLDALRRHRLVAEEPELPLREIAIDIAQTKVVDIGGRKISSYEAKELDLLWGAQLLHDTAAGLDTIGALVGMVPQMEGAAKPWGIGVGISFGGVHLKQVLDAGSAAARGIAGRLSYEANQSAKLGSYQRREQEWAFQRNIVTTEITEIYKQWRAAQIREALAEREWRNHQQQIRDAEEVEQFLSDPKNGKTSNAEFYGWLRREVRGLYGQCFQFAFDVAKQAERALQHELGAPNETFLRYGYRAGKEGLLAGERLYLDLRRMEMAYHDQNRREYELTTHVSLRQLDPVALLTLRATGACEFTVSEEVLDLIGAPGHYFRRLKAVALSIPCVVGPYGGVNATLSLQGSSVRISPALMDGEYARAAGSDDRFSDYLGGLQSMVASSATGDSGLFEVNLRDERYLPFEGSGAISRWRIELPTQLPQFDRDTITDVILHLRYTAREGGALLRTAAQNHVRQRVSQASAAGCVRLLSVRHEFPGEWARFVAAGHDEANNEAPLTLTLREEHYPYWTKAVAPISLHRMDLFAEPGADTAPTVTVSTAPIGDASRTSHPLVTDNALGGVRVGQLAVDPLPDAVGELTLHIDDNTMRDLWLVLTWGGPPG